MTSSNPEKETSSSQQRETLDYFNQFAVQWFQKASRQSIEQINITKLRNDYVIKACDEMDKDKVRSALDVGCGSGELVCALAKKNIRTTGIDFSPEMIKWCRETARSQEIKDAHILYASIIDYQPPDQRFDLITANGFIEYISPDELQWFFRRAAELLNPGGCLIISSRNRLFNLFSLNEYSLWEKKMGSWKKIYEEALMISTARSVEECIRRLTELDATYPPGMDQPVTGVTVRTRYQYTPAELLRRLNNSALATRDLYPVHVHGVPPRFGKEYPVLKAVIANLVQEKADFSLLPFSSTFMIKAQSGKGD